MARVVGLVLRIFSFLFHFALIAFIFAVSILAWQGGHTLTIELLPWPGPDLTYVLFGAGLAGLVSLALALGRSMLLRVPFATWNVIVLAVLVRGYSSNSFGFGPGGGSLSLALALVFGAFLAVVGSWLHWRGATKRAAARRA